MRKIFLTAFLTIAALQASANQVVNVDGLSINWVDGFKLYRKAAPIRLSSKDGVTVLITARTYPPDSNSAARFEDNQHFANAQLPVLAAAKGKVIQALKREEYPDGSLLFSTATSVSRGHHSMFYLQFMILSPSSNLALITVEGPGNPATAIEKYRPLLDSVQWK